MRSSVLIVNWRTEDLLRKLLESIRKYPIKGENEVIVIDNDAEYFHIDEMRESFPEVVFLPQNENLGFSEGNNTAFKASSGDTIVMLNPDTEVTEGALEILVRFVEENPKVGIVSPQLVFPDGRVQDSCRAFPWPLGIIFTAARLHKIFPKSKLFGQYRMTWFDHNTRMQVEQPMASCWALPRRVIEEIGFMDPEFPILFNDVDYAWRVWKAGYEIWFLPEVKVFHVGAQGTKKASLKMPEASHRGLVRFYDKNMRGEARLIWLAKTISWINWKMRYWHALRKHRQGRV